MTKMAFDFKRVRTDKMAFENIIELNTFLGIDFVRVALHAINDFEC